MNSATGARLRLEEAGSQIKKSQSASFGSTLTKLNFFSQLGFNSGPDPLFHSSRFAPVILMRDSAETNEADFRVIHVTN